MSPISVVAPRGGSANKGPSGVANVRQVGKNFVINFPDEPDEFKFTKEEFKTMTGGTFTGKFFVSVSKKGDKIYGLRPATGAYTVKFEKFASQENKPPIPFSVPARQARKKDGTIFDVPAKQKFTALLEIIDGPYTGIEIPLYLEYRFVASLDGHMALPQGRGNEYDNIFKFLQYTGAFDGKSIEFSDNVLPELEKSILEQDKVFMVTLDKGYVNTLTEAPSYLSDKKSAKKPSKPKTKTSSKK